MRRNILLVTFFLILILVVWNNCKKDPADYPDQVGIEDNVYITENDNWLRFQDEDGYYSVQYPFDWELEDHSFKNEMIRADISREAHTGIQIRIIRKSSTDLVEFTESYINQFMNEMESHWKGSIEEIERSFKYIDGNYGCKSSIIFEREDGENWLFIEYIWLRNSYTLVFQCGTKLELRSVKEPILDKIAASLEFLK